ncbi:Rab-GTPase-TBC domain [Trinorchestia longiramus]|nr:Rab-GTPase-TBC domain [Trinorchestia longiramus]
MAGSWSAFMCWLLLLLLLVHPSLSESVRTRSLSDKENRHGTLGAKESVVSKTSDCTDTAGNRSETSAPHRVHFGEVVENGSKCAEAASSKSSLKKVKLAASHPDWRKLLDEFGSFPSSERAAVWCGLLRLPRCAVIHRNLDGKVLHDAVPLYSSMADQSLRNTFRRTLSCLYYWAPQLSSVPWVPSFVFPFVKSLQHTPLICFELCVTLLVSWCRLWFSTAPDALVPPVLNTVEMLVCDASPRLMAALMHAHVTAHTYVWPLLSTAFAQVLSAEDWAVAWDHLLCRPPSFLLCFAAAYTLCLAPAIRTAAADQPRHIENLYSQESYLPVRSVLKRAAELHDSMKLDAELLCRLDAITPFPEGGLPVFHNIPDMQAIKLDSSAAEGGGGALQTLGWSLDEAEFERERAALREREERCIAAIRRVRKQHFGLS